MSDASYTFKDQYGVWHLIVWAGTDLVGRYPRSICSWWQAQESRERMANGEGFKLRLPYPPTCIECVIREGTWTK